VWGSFSPSFPLLLFIRVFAGGPGPPPPSLAVKNKKTPLDRLASLVKLSLRLSYVKGNNEVPPFYLLSLPSISEEGVV